MNTLQWASIAFTCGIWLGYYMPKFLEWLATRYDKKIEGEYERYLRNKEDKDEE